MQAKTMRSQAIATAVDVSGTDMEDLVNVSLTGGPEAAGQAREELRRMPLDLDETVHDNLRLLVTELVTNSVRHTCTAAVKLMVLAAPHTVRVEVADRGPGFKPKAPRKPTEREGGWGLYLVDSLADRWGVLSVNGATHVWCELDR
jgi:anti-sigma regulatory factor (Ser/Thr protein kinase)